MPTGTIYYFYQCRRSYKGRKKIYYGEYFFSAQILEREDAPQDMENHILEEREVLLFHPKYDIISGKFKELYKATGEIVVRGNSHEFFADYGF